MNQTQIEVAGKVFIVVGGRKRKCLVCDGILTPKQAANHAKTRCYPSRTDSEADAAPVSYS